MMVVAFERIVKVSLDVERGRWWSGRGEVGVALLLTSIVSSAGLLYVLDASLLWESRIRAVMNDLGQN